MTAGLMWHPEMEPIAYAAHSSARPKAIETPRTPTDPDSKKSPVARIAVPGPPTMRIIVPTPSARAIRVDLFMSRLLQRVRLRPPVSVGNAGRSAPGMPHGRHPPVGGAPSCPVSCPRCSVARFGYRGRAPIRSNAAPLVRAWRRVHATLGVCADRVRTSSHERATATAAREIVHRLISFRTYVARSAIASRCSCRRRSVLARRAVSAAVLAARRPTVAPSPDPSSGRRGASGTAPFGPSATCERALPGIRRPVDGTAIAHASRAVPFTAQSVPRRCTHSPDRRVATRAVEDAGPTADHRALATRTVVERTVVGDLLTQACANDARHSVYGSGSPG